jgi:transposase-like protein
MQDGEAGKLAGEVEVDETFIGGKARNMHLDERQRRITGTGGKDKAIVFGALERGGNVKAVVVQDRKKYGLHAQVKSHVEAGSALYSDALRSYDGLAQDYAHKVIDYAEKYVDGKVHTNGLENFWSLLKRGISGTYISTEPFHLFRYNNRNNFEDFGRFNLTVSRIIGKRLTFAALTGKVPHLCSLN